MRARASLLMIAALACGCSSTLPATHYYQLSVAETERAAAPKRGVLLALEPLAVDAAYATERIVYRKSPYRLDYYHYHRWSSPPGLQVTEYLRRAYSRSGMFGHVTLDPVRSADVVLGGRLIAFEEVDETDARWLGRVTLELRLHEAESGRVLWLQVFSEEEPLTAQSPEGLARALSVALQRIVLASSDSIARVAASVQRPGDSVSSDDP